MKILDVSSPFCLLVISLQTIWNVLNQARFFPSIKVYRCFTNRHYFFIVFRIEEDLFLVFSKLNEDCDRSECTEREQKINCYKSKSETAKRAKDKINILVILLQF